MKQAVKIAQGVSLSSAYSHCRDIALDFGRHVQGCGGIRAAQTAS